MSRRRTLIASTAACALLAAFLAIGLGVQPSSAGTPPPAGSDPVAVSADVSITSRLGSETIHLTGSATISHGDAYDDSGTETFDTQITALSLSGSSVTGAVTVSQSATLDSPGQVRGTDPAPSQWPADSFFDVFVDAVIPASPNPTVTLHNKAGFHLVAQGITEWPPYGVKFAMQLPSITPSPTPTGPVPTPYPGTPLCNNGIRLVPELPAEICVTGVSVTLSAGTPFTVTSTPSRTATRTPTRTPTPTGSATLTPTSTRTPTPTGSATATPTVTVTPTPTWTPFFPPPSWTRIPTDTPTLVVTPTPYRNGDANCDGRGDAVDAALILQWSARLPGAIITCLQAIDVNGDGHSDAVDALLILQYAAGLIDSLPV